MKRLLLLLLAVGMVFAFSTTAYSVEFDTGEFEVRATVVATCELETPVDIDFGEYGGVEKSGGSRQLLRVRCLNPIPYKVSLDGGLYSNQNGDRRAMIGPTGQFLKYEIFKGVDGNIWGGPQYRGTSWIGNVGNGDFQDFSATWKLWSRQFGRETGGYTDTVGVTVYY
jgi:spore coat protein U-like protein